jgi:hypothetical protein
MTVPAAIHLLIAAQALLASLTGIVRDEHTGAPVHGATVTLVDFDRSVVTDTEGRYALPDVPPGPQHVAVRRMGYQPRTFHALVPREGPLVIDVSLKPAPIPLEEVEVRTAVPISGLEEPVTRFPDRRMTVAAVRHHPLLAEPDMLEAVRGGEVTLHPEAPNGIHVRGGSSDQIAYVLDGIPVLSPYHAAGTFGAWNPDALSSIELHTVSPPPAYPDALSGVLAGTTRAPGTVLCSQGSVSTTQARLTFDGPLGFRDAGYLVSTRLSFPGLIYHPHESSHLRGDGSDWIAKLELPLLGGRLRGLGYASLTEIEAATRVRSPADTIPRAVEANEFGWDSRSYGVTWTRPFDDVALHLRAWSVAGNAQVLWWSRDSLPPQRLDSEQRYAGAVGYVDLARGRNRTAIGVRLEQDRTRYRVAAGDSTLDAIEATAPVAAAFVQQRVGLGRRVEAEVSLTGTSVNGTPYLDPAVQARWQPADNTSVTCECSRRHQYAQSLRNPESISTNIFPADLYVAAGGEVPAAESDLGVVAIEHRPVPGLRFAAQAYARRFESLVLVASTGVSPFATGDFARGSGEARGFTVQAGANGARYGVMADYGYQRVRYEYGDTTYAPEHGAQHSLDAGLVVFPTPTWSVRVGLLSLFGRRGTAFVGPWEWESCNLVDWGCEFAGSPDRRADALGATTLPSYVRVDVGLRKHWHLPVRGRDVEIALFASASNVLGRSNVMAVTVDPSTGKRQEVGLRPQSPLVIGLDWRF